MANTAHPLIVQRINQHRAGQAHPPSIPTQLAKGPLHSHCTAQHLCHDRRVTAEHDVRVTALELMQTHQGKRTHMRKAVALEKRLSFFTLAITRRPLPRPTWTISNFFARKSPCNVEADAQRPCCSINHRVLTAASSVHHYATGSCWRLPAHHASSKPCQGCRLQELAGCVNSNLQSVRCSMHVQVVQLRH